MLIQSRDVSDGFWTLAPSIGSGLMPLAEMQIGFGYPQIVAIIVIPAILIVSFLAMRHNFKREMIPYWIVFLGIPLMAFAISWLWHPIYIYRGLLPAISLIILFYARWIVTARPIGAALLYIALAIVLPYKLHPDAARIDLHSFVAACDSQPIYTIDVASAIIADIYSDARIVMYPDYNNWNQELNRAAVYALGYELSYRPPRRICFYFQDTPMTTEVQREQAAFVVHDLDLSCQRVLDKQFYVVEVCQ
jgi:hypothetical protein